MVKLPKLSFNDMFSYIDFNGTVMLFCYNVNELFKLSYDKTNSPGVDKGFKSG